MQFLLQCSSNLHQVVKFYVIHRSLSFCTFLVFWRKMSNTIRSFYCIVWDIILYSARVHLLMVKPVCISMHLCVSVSEAIMTYRYYQQMSLSSSRPAQSCSPTQQIFTQCPRHGKTRYVCSVSKKNVGCPCLILQIHISIHYKRLDDSCTFAV